METLRRSSRQRKSLSALELLGIERKRVAVSFKNDRSVKEAHVKQFSSDMCNPGVRQSEIDNGSKDNLWFGLSSHNNQTFSNYVAKAETLDTNDFLSCELLPRSCSAILETSAGQDEVDAIGSPGSTEEHGFKNEKQLTKSVMRDVKQKSKDLCVLLTVVPSKTTGGDTSLLMVPGDMTSLDDEASQPIIFKNGFNIRNEFMCLDVSDGVKQLTDNVSG
jgi:hypothetical protein